MLLGPHVLNDLSVCIIFQNTNLRVRCGISISIPTTYSTTVPIDIPTSIPRLSTTYIHASISPTHTLSLQP